MNTKLFSALAITAATLSTTVANASPYAVGEAHNKLISAVRSTGIQFIINGPMCDEPDAPMGYYWAYKNEFVVCQENRIKGQGIHQKEVRWTAEDLDTLRHEAHHVVQDCMNQEYRDGELGAVYKNPVEVAQMFLSEDTLWWIVNEGYAQEDDHTKVMEMEAFAVAAMNDPLEQVRDINKFCF